MAGPLCSDQLPIPSRLMSYRTFPSLCAVINAISNISIVDNENERKLIKQSPGATSPGERSLAVRMDWNSTDRRVNPLGGEGSAVK